MRQLCLQETQIPVEKREYFQREKTKRQAFPVLFDDDVGICGGGVGSGSSGRGRRVLRRISWRHGRGLSVTNLLEGTLGEAEKRVGVGEQTASDCREYTPNGQKRPQLPDIDRQIPQPDVTESDRDCLD